ncbi:hypothetical protein BCEP27_190034 [Burkholderia cepacia]
MCRVVGHVGGEQARRDAIRDRLGFRHACGQFRAQLYTSRFNLWREKSLSGKVGKFDNHNGASNL